MAACRKTSRASAPRKVASGTWGWNDWGWNDWSGTKSIKTIGFIGIGNMGRPMATNLVKGGYQVVAYDVDTNRAAQFAKDVGAKSAATLAELGKSVDAIVTMLPTGKEVRAVLLEAEGGAPAANPCK